MTQDIKCRAIINCDYCNKEFEKKKSIFCSLSCAKRGAGIFSKEQIDFIESYLQRVPPQELIDQVIRRYPQYTRRQIQDRITRSANQKGISTRPCIGVWEISNFAQTLGVPYTRVDSWFGKGLKTSKNNKTQRGKKHIHRKDFDNFVLLRPDLFKGVKISNIRKVTKNKKVLEALLNLANLPHPRDAVIIRLNTGEVYRSAKEAMRLLNCEVSDKGILYNCSSDRPMINGMNFYKLQYPCFEIPLELKSEFLYYAGQVFYELYLELCNIDGFTKSGLIVAARNSIRISVLLFKKQAIQVVNGEPLTPKQELSQFYQSLILRKIKMLYGQKEADCYRSVLNSVINRIFSIFKSFYIDDARAQMYAEEFAFSWVGKASDRFFRLEFIPQGYEPKTQLEKADYWQAIHHSSRYAKVVFDSGKSVLLCVLAAYGFLKKQPLQMQYNDALNNEQRTDEQYPDEISSILEGLASLSITEELRRLCSDYVACFLDFQDSEKVRDKLEINLEKEEEVLSCLRRAAAPF